MFGEYNNIIVKVFDSISKFFTDLSCKTSEVFSNYDNGHGNRFQKALYILIGAFFLLIYGVFGLVYAVFQIFIPAKRRHDTQKFSLKTKEIACAFATCLAIFITFYFLNKTEYAKNINRIYYDSRTEINSLCKSDLLAVNSSGTPMGSHIYYLRNSLESKKTSDEVLAVRSVVNDSLPEGLHFATLNDYLITLLSIEDFEALGRFATSYDEMNSTEIFNGYLQQFCKISFQFNRFHTSDTCLDIILDYSDYDSISPDSDYNNSFYLMRLFNENIMDRYNSCNVNNKLLAAIVDDVDAIKELRADKFMSPASSHDKDIIEYINSLNQFHNGHQSGDYPKNRFITLAQKAKSEVLKQYSLNMYMRSQFWHTDWLIKNNANGTVINKNLALLDQAKEMCRNELTYPYLYKDIDLYKLNASN